MQYFKIFLQYFQDFGLAIFQTKQIYSYNLYFFVSNFANLTVLFSNLSRRFSASFADLRIMHRKVHGLKKAETIDAFDKEVFDWPAKIFPQQPQEETEEGQQQEVQQPQELQQPQEVPPHGSHAAVQADDIGHELEGEDEAIRFGVTMTGRVSGS